ncbi:MAG: TatD family hydrolase [Deltaproteobacteria bacterium]|nr:TatD family hydrolase [Deltaproteobacteria bacterium]
MLIDSHAHLDMQDFNHDRNQVIERAIKGGLSRIITVGINMASSIAALKLTREYDSVFAAVGYHPHNASECNRQALNKLTETASDPKVVAWGEIGLDFYRNRSLRDVQMNVFLQQLEIAGELGLPVIIHDRDAHNEILSILKKIGKGDRKGVIHCFSGDTNMAMTLIELGYYISISGVVTFKKASLIKEVASNIPLERLLVETDSPYLAPAPKRGKRNEPLFVTYTAKEISRLRGIEPDELAVALSANTERLFDLPAVS